MFCDYYPPDSVVYSFLATVVTALGNKHSSRFFLLRKEIRYSNNEISIRSTKPKSEIFKEISELIF